MLTETRSVTISLNSIFHLPKLYDAVVIHNREGAECLVFVTCSNNRKHSILGYVPEKVMSEAYNRAHYIHI